jgi:hypothetical protein
MNSSKPQALVSTLCQARSRRVGRSWTGPTILPAVTRHEVAARVARDRHSEFADQVQHVAAEPVLIRARMLWLIDSGVDAPTHVLDEGTEGAQNYRRDDEVRVKGERGSQHWRPMVDRAQLTIWVRARRASWRARRNGSGVRR